MTTGGEIYLAIVLAVFLSYAAILFWAMVTTVSRDMTTDERERPHS